MKTGILKNNKGVSLLELVVVLAIVGILAAFGIPQYGRFSAKNSVRRAATELMQSMRMTRTMAIKENRTYLITLDAGTNTYRIGFDANTNGSLTDVGDVHGQGPVRVINVQNKYGTNVVLGESNFAVDPPNDPNGNAISEQSSFNFLPDSSVRPNGIICFQETNRSYTLCVEMANTAGKTNLFIWQGDEDNPLVTTWTELR